MSPKKKVSTKKTSKKGGKKMPHLIYIRLKGPDQLMLGKLREWSGFKANSRTLMKAGKELLEIQKREAKLKEEVLSLKEKVSKEVQAQHAVKREFLEVLEEEVNLQKKQDQVLKEKLDLIKKYKSSHYSF